MSRFLQRAAVMLMLFLPAFCQQDSASAAKPRSVSKSDAKKAEQTFKRAIRLQNEGRLEDAMDALSESADLNPANPDYAAAHEYVRAERVAEHMERGNQLMVQDRRDEARLEFQAALALDPQNPFAQQRLRDASTTGKPILSALTKWDYATEPELRPKPIRR